MIDPTACIIGWPIDHSRSPLIHRHWLSELGIAGDYVALPVEPGHAEGFFRAFAESGFVGGNVTAPHKEAAFRAVHAMDDNAAALGAVNTIWLDGGQLVGANTDVHGFLANLDECAPDWDKRDGSALVLGAGGVARAVIWGLLGRDFESIRVANRTAERAETLAAQFGRGVIPVEWADLPETLGQASIIVNCTSLGMENNPPLEIGLEPVRPGTVVNDLIYVPLETPLIRDAKNRDLVAVGGLGMLLHQAVPGFQKWFGHRPVVTDELRRLVARDILARS